MSTQAKMQQDPLERLKTALEDAPRDHEFLAEYVRELLGRRTHEEDIFLRLAFQNVSSGGGAYRGADLLGASIVSELYEPLDAERKLEVMRWWHEKVRQEAGQFDDLKTRLSKLS